MPSDATRSSSNAKSSVDKDDEDEEALPSSSVLLNPQNLAFALAASSQLFGAIDSPFNNSMNFPTGFFSPSPNDLLNQMAANISSGSVPSVFHSGATSPFLQSTSSAIIPTSSAQMVLARNSTKTLKCPKCNWHYKYQETLEIHMKEKHSEDEVNCTYCAHNQPHPKLARGESYSCGYKPYRCDLCKYSTTTKGNLSIHMQSDKHLHAMHEMPLNMGVGTTHHNPTQGPSGSVSDEPPSGRIEADQGRLLQCLICGNFATTDINAMLEHLEVDRSRTYPGDIQALHGLFQCNLCPYSTNLKANFQLHTRTDKHLQRVQLINHMREGMSNRSTTTTAASALCRLAAMKSVVQVSCRACQDVFSCAYSLREHCESRVHQAQINFLTQQQQMLSDHFPELTRLPNHQEKEHNKSDISSHNPDYEFQNLLIRSIRDPTLMLTYQCFHCSLEIETVDVAKEQQE
ncbi:zinc finger homeobox protein 4 [Ditylenchus destructor]|uniref:Zinc finger homeobox protein 4 n=1 Tax=Ditylenchus destructor TaxID=166010 RepID=A0AAD4R783_9BILA|nr:zinc finger homeobox protein 4 [Ditylenchus destructor]